MGQSSEARRTGAVALMGPHHHPDWRPVQTMIVRADPSMRPCLLYLNPGLLTAHRENSHAYAAVHSQPVTKLRSTPLRTSLARPLDPHRLDYGKISS